MRSLLHPLISSAAQWSPWGGLFTVRIPALVQVESPLAFY